MRRLALLSGLAIFAVCAFSHLDHRYLTAHMVQHLLIMTVAAPLLLYGHNRPLSLHPVPCFFVGTFTVVLWHVPSVLEFGLGAHLFQHTTFLVAGLLFWIPVFYPWRRWSGWSVPLYLFFGTMPCDALSAFLTFCGRPIYPSHYSVDDQGLAGALMWVWVTIAYLVPAAIVTMRLLAPRTGPALKWQR